MRKSYQINKMKLEIDISDIPGAGELIHPGGTIAFKSENEYIYNAFGKCYILVREQEEIYNSLNFTELKKEQSWIDAEVVNDNFFVFLHDSEGIYRVDNKNHEPILLKKINGTSWYGRGINKCKRDKVLFNFDGKGKANAFEISKKGRISYQMEFKNTFGSFYDSCTFEIGKNIQGFIIIDRIALLSGYLYDIRNRKKLRKIHFAGIILENNSTGRSIECCEKSKYFIAGTYTGMKQKSLNVLELNNKLEFEVKATLKFLETAEHDWIHNIVTMYSENEMNLYIIGASYSTHFKTNFFIFCYDIEKETLQEVFRSQVIIGTVYSLKWVQSKNEKQKKLMGCSNDNKIFEVKIIE